DRKSTRLNSSHGSTSYAVFCLKKKTIARQTKDLEAKSTTLQSRLEELTKERAEIAGKIEEDLLSRFERLFKSKGDAVLVALEHEVCTGCHMKVTAQTAHRVKAGREIVSCENWCRILYDAGKMRS